MNGIIIKGPVRIFEKTKRRRLMKSRFRLFVLTWIFSFFLFPPSVLNAADKLPSLDTGQSISMDLQNANLKDVLKIFSIQSGLNFIASENVEDRQVTLYLDKVPIKDAMNRLFEANNLTYSYDKASNIFIVQYWGEPQINTITKIYKLKYRSVSSSNLEKEKMDLFEEGLFSQNQTDDESDSTSSSRNNSDTAQTEADITGSVKQVLSSNGKLNEDSRTNSLIITDIPSRFPVIEEVLAALDVPQPQVMLEVEMLDVNKNTMDEIGFNIGDLDSPNPLTIMWPQGFALSKLDYYLGDSTKANSAGAVTLGTKYSMLLDFMIQQSDTKFLARPRILTLNNETAEIGVTKDTIVSVKSTRTTDASGNPIVDTEYERATSLALTPEGIGIFLRVTPQINLDSNEITMVINPKTSSATQSESVADEVALDPEVRSTKSIVKIKDGETVVLGGLIHHEKSVIKRKVPLLGDIPLLGALFRHKSTDKNLERELLVFITPHIVRDPNIRLAQNTLAEPLSQPLAPANEEQRKVEINKILNVFDEKKN